MEHTYLNEDVYTGQGTHPKGAAELLNIQNTVELYSHFKQDLPVNDKTLYQTHVSNALDKAVQEQKNNVVVQYFNAAVEEHNKNNNSPASTSLFNSMQSAVKYASKKEAPFKLAMISILNRKEKQLSENGQESFATPLRNWSQELNKMIVS